MRGLVSILFALACGSCAPATMGLLVDLRTDFRPGVDFASVQTEVSATAFTSPTPTGMITSDGATAADYLAGARIDERPTLADGDWFVRVTLLASSGARVGQRAVSLHLEGRHALTIVIARSCTGVMCPPASDGSLTECNGGVCVSPSCTPENPLACPAPACTTDSACAPPGPCARTTCASGVCLALPDDAQCAGGTCGADFQCDTGATPFTLHHLASDATSWEVLTPSGAAPTALIQAAFTLDGSDEIFVMTRSELYVLGVSTLAFVDLGPRDAVFPELAGIDVEAATIVNRELYVTAHDVWVYAWAEATRSATLTHFVPFADLGVDWHGPLTPPTFRIFAELSAPGNANGWAHADPMQLCGAFVSGKYLEYLSWDGSDPPTMIASTWDANCGQFVDRSPYGSAQYAAFTYPGTPSAFEIVAAEWYEGLWVFTSP